MAFTIGAGLALEGEKQFKDAIKGINKDLSVLSSEMKKVTSQFDGSAESMEALTAKQKVYSERADEQRKKIEVMTAALESAKREYGENSDKVKDWQIKLNNAEADLAKTEKSLRDTTNQIDNFGKEADDGGAAIEKAGKQAKKSGDDAEKGKSGWVKLGDGLKNVGKLAAAAAAAAVAAAAGVGAMTVEAAYAADDINTLAKQTGLSTEEIQKFRYASEQIDVPLETMTKSMARNIKSMKAVQDGTKLSVDAYKALGVEVLNADGSLRDGQTVYGEVIDALAKMENETERDALAMQILGKSAQELNPLILGGADALKKLGDEAEAAGLILDQDALDNLNLLSDSMDTFKATVKGSGSLFGTAFAAPMAEGLDFVTDSLHELTAAFSEGGFDELAERAGEILTNIVTKITENLPRMIELGMRLLSTLADGIIQNLPLIVETAMGIVVQLANGLVEALPKLVPKVVEVVLAITQTLINNIPLLIDAALQLITGLAEGIIEAIPVIIDALPELITSLIDGLLGAIPQIIEAGIQLLTALIGALPEIIQKIVEALPKIIDGIITALMDNIPLIIDAGIKLFVALIENLPLIIVEIVKAIPQIIKALVEGFAQFFSTMAEIGLNLIKGIWQGIKDAGAWLWEKIKGFFTGIWDGIKDFLGIRSPSTLFAGIGKNMALGIGEGFESAMTGVSRQIQDSVPTSIDTQINATARMGESIVNGMSTLLGGTGGDATFIFKLNDIEFARGILPGFRRVTSAEPIVVGDY